MKSIVSYALLFIIINPINNFDQVLNFSAKEYVPKKEGHSLDNQLLLKDWLEGKKFKNRDHGLVVQYGYISRFNTYGFTFTNSYDNKFYFINCSSEITSDQTYGVFSECINPDNGSGIGRARVYKNSKKIVIGDASGEFIYYLIVE